MNESQWGWFFARPASHREHKYKGCLHINSTHTTWMHKEHSHQQSPTFRARLALNEFLSHWPSPHFALPRHPSQKNAIFRHFYQKTWISAQSFCLFEAFSSIVLLKNVIKFTQLTAHGEGLRARRCERPAGASAAAAAWTKVKWLRIAVSHRTGIAENVWRLNQITTKSEWKVVENFEKSSNYACDDDPLPK